MKKDTHTGNDLQNSSSKQKIERHEPHNEHIYQWNVYNGEIEIISFIV